LSCTFTSTFHVCLRTNPEYLTDQHSTEDYKGGCSRKKIFSIEDIRLRREADDGENYCQAGRPENLPLRKKKM
jgi:hypothetical protein